MYITGIGRTKFGISDKTLSQLAYEAMVKALKDSTISINDIGAIYVSNFLGGILENQLHLNSLISSLLPGLNIPIIRIETACASGGAAFYAATMALSSHDHVMVIGVEKMTGFDSEILPHGISSAGDVYADQKKGVIFPAGYALIADQYIQKYGITADDFALASLKAHQNANLNPLAHFYQKKVSLQEIKESMMVCSPTRLFNCSPISDGAAAAILSREKRSGRDVEVLACSLRTDSISLSHRKEITSFPAVKLAAEDAYAKANLTPADIDVAEIHDGFTIAEVVGMEDLGFCKPGESKYLLQREETTLKGRIPVNTSGGLKANGHPIGATGVCQIGEIVTQLRGEAGDRQVKNAKIGLAHNIGGVGGTAIVTILRK